MARSTSGSIPTSLAKTYDHFVNKKKKKFAFNSSSVNSTVEEKMKAAGIFDAELAATLADKDKLWELFFSQMILDNAREAVDGAIEEGELTFIHSMEREAAFKRGSQRFGSVCNFPVKLVFTPLKRGRRMASTFSSMLEMRFGPLHAALQVGEVLVEWNDSSLVCPRLCNAEDRLMEVDVQFQRKWTGKHGSDVKKATQELDFSQQVELIYTVTSENSNLIEELIKVIIHYNKFYYYNLFDRNCQHFVLDAVKALQVEMPKLPGGLGKYFRALVKGKTPSIPAEFKTHSALDEYVMCKKTEGVIGSMPQHDLEFLLALYFRFHLESKAKLKDDTSALDRWQCGEHCCMAEVEKHLQMDFMQIHLFTD